MAYGARLEIVLGVKTLAGSNPASSAAHEEYRSLQARVRLAEASLAATPKAATEAGTVS